MKRSAFHYFNLRYWCWIFPAESLDINYYRMMHFSAKRGIAIAWCPSVRPPVMLVDQDHIGWTSWKLIARTLSPTPLLFIAQRPSTYSHAMGTWGNFWETRSGVGKEACWSTTEAISLKCVNMEEKLLWRAYWKSTTLFPTVPFLTPYGLFFPMIGVCNPTRNSNSYYLRNG